MRIIPPPEPSVVEAAYVAPLVTPIVAIPATAIFLTSAVDGGYLSIAIPFIIVFSLIFGYLGMFLVCLPIAALLDHFKKLDAIRLCFYTCAVGTAAWAYMTNDHHQPVINSAAAGFVCSLAVTALFCYLYGIRFVQADTA
jgi:hypothetical protein